MAEYAVVLTTCGSREEAQTLARGLVEARLAACVQLMDIQSVYRWEGSIQEDPEVLLLIKTRRDRYADVEQYIRTHHSYEVPEIVQLPIQEGFAPYLHWIDQMVSPEDDKQ